MRSLPLLSILLLAALLGACSETTTQLENGQPAPPFRLLDLAGQTVAFPADFRGRVVAIRFWADWCPFCEHEMKQLEPVYRKYRERGLEILAVNVRQSRDTAAKFVQALGISYPTLLDEEGEVARGYGVMGLPTTFFVDGRGVLRAKVLGESTPEVFEQIVTGILPPG